MDGDAQAGRPEALAEAEATGEVTTREEALARARAITEARP